MPTFLFQKLVRDKIVDHQTAAGATVNHRTLSPAEHKHALVRKIVEESQELLDAEPGDVAAEIADVQQALDDLKHLYGISDETVVRAQAAKTSKNGAFQKGLYIESITLPENDTWAAYYRQHPDRYPEVSVG